MDAPRKPRARDVAAVFDRWADEGRGDRMETGHRATAGRVLASLPLRPGERLLDLGTGNGWAAREAALRGARVVAIDLSPRMLALARGRGGEVAYARATFDRLPFKDAQFDRVFGMEAIYYAEDLPGALAEIARVVAPGGRLHLIVDRYLENPDSHAWPEKVGVGMHLLSEGAWRLHVEAAGFLRATAQRVRAAPGTGDPWHATVGSLLVEATRGTAPDAESADAS